MAPHVDEQFYDELCDRLGIGAEGHGTPQQRQERRDAAKSVFRAWERAEGSQAEWNPFDTTWSHEQGATAYNSFGPGRSLHVMNYPTRAEGVDATAQSLLHGASSYGYEAIVHALRDGDAEAAAHAIEASAWGTKGVARLLGGGQPDSGQQDGAHRQNVRQLQSFLAQHGHAPANSQDRAGHFDGAYGPGTQAALAAFLTDDNGQHRDHPVHGQVVALQTFLDHHGVNVAASSRTKDGGWDGKLGTGTRDELAAFLGVQPGQL